MKLNLPEGKRGNAVFTVLAALIVGVVATSIYIDKLDDDRTVIIYTSDSSNAADDSSEISKAKSSGKTDTLTESKTESMGASRTTTAKIPASKAETSAKTTTTVTVSSKAPVEFPIDINKVTYEELIEINGIGDSTANSIINFRYSVGIITNMNELLEIYGIGESTLALLKQYLFVAEEDYRKITVYSETEAPITTAPPETVDAFVEITTVTEQTTAETTTVTTEAEPQRQPVNINFATAEEIAHDLLIDEELAEAIVALREQLGGSFTNDLELLYEKKITKQLLLELRPYILLEEQEVETE